MSIGDPKKRLVKMELKFVITADKFCFFGKKILVFGHFVNVYLVFNNILNKLGNSWQSGHTICDWHRFGCTCQDIKAGSQYVVNLVWPAIL